jgi:ribosomal protein S18 acetylase RimI-like enzyme
MAMTDFHVRAAVAADLPVLGRLGAHLMRAHYAFDSRRFMAPGADPEQGYTWFLGKELQRTDVAIFVAERAGEVVGYVYAGIEPVSWKELRDESGYVHDLVVDEHQRRGGIATALMQAAMDWLTERGLPRVVLWTAQPNDAAQQLFDRLGFRRTMIEMTREL